MRRDDDLSGPPSPSVVGLTFQATPTEVFYTWDRVGVCSVREGREILFSPAPSAPPQRLRLYLLGAALASALQQRGRLVLHASATATPRGSVLFLGDCGSGKSTLAAALHRAGFPMMADDVTVIDADAPAPIVWPAFPLFKLWPDSLTALGALPEDLPRIAPEAEKRARPVDAAFAREPLPLHAIYILEPRPDVPAGNAAVEITPLAGGAAFLELVRNTFCARQLPAAGQERHFRQCARIAADIPARVLRRKGSGFALDDLVAVLRQDLGL